MNTFLWPLLRDAGRLVLLQNQPLPTVGKRLRCRSVDSAWRLERTELINLPDTAGNAALRSVRAAWARLGQASYDPETLAALLLVLCASGSAGGRCAMSLPRLCRADMRPWLNDAVAVGALLRTLSPLAASAFRLLTAHRWLPHDELRAVEKRLDELDLFVLTRCRERICATDADAALPLSRELLVLAPPGRRWLDAGMAAMAMQAMQLDVAEDGMGLAARVWTLSGSGWLREVAALQRGDHVVTLRLLVETKAAVKAPPADVRRVFTALHHSGKPERRQADLRWIIKGLKRGASAGFLACALRFAKASMEGDVGELCEAPQGQRTLSSHLFTWMVKATCLHCARRAWLAAAKVPELQDALAQMRSVRLSNWAMHDLLRSLSSVYARKAKHPPVAMDDQKRLATLIVSRVRRLGRKQGANWITALRHLFTWKAPITSAGFDQAIQLNDRFHHLASHGADNISAVLGAMVEVKGEQMLHLAAKLDDNWCKRMAEAGATWVRRDRALDGIRRLDGRAMDMLWAACRFLPTQWFNTMQELACVPEARIRALMDSAAEHPLFACRLRLDELRLALVMIDSVREERCKTNPVSTRLREHVAGRRALPAHSLEHDLALLYRGWLEAQLHLINELIQREIWRAFPGLKPESGITDHSLKLALTMDGNERPLRRLIRSVARGEAGGADRHPLNQRWQGGLGEPCASRWSEGIAAVRVLPSLGEVIIAPEDDPQEVLRMGSAVGSCLALGSFNSFSAAANALDANKRVIYARTREGKVVGRQLLAISEEKRLVCFSPYPVKLRGPLVDFFADYDHVLASHLGIPLHRMGGYTIKALVAKDWYDDGMWHRLSFAA